MPENGGLNLSNVTGNITFGSGHVAGGDVVVGNKTVTTTTTTTTIQSGFAKEDDKTEFQAKLDQLAKTLQQVQKLVELEDSISEADKQAIAAEVAKQVTASVEAKVAVAAAPVGAPAPTPVADQITRTLDHAGSFVEKIQAAIAKAGPAADTVLTVAKKAAPILLAARHLFGLP